MGKSAKFYKRPSKKEKEGIALKKLVEPTAISKKKTKEAKTISVPVDMLKPQKAEQDTDIDMDAKPAVKKEKKKNEAELPDYVDLFSGKKTYKKIPGKRK
ncbi:hypothetical protein BD560DRAFT_451417 [Blakeslea trispora]|nr:hypothetical protein BD560DRAFT_451417 [Blakeslea trispora]